MATPARVRPDRWLGDLAEQRFPLLPRPKPPCQPLAQRIARVSWLAGHASRATSQPIAGAAQACNLAALIASDCGMPSLARDLCWHQASAFAQASIRDEATAKFALQPLVNLARLHIRDGNGDAGYQLLESLYAGARDSRAEVAIDGRTVTLTALALPGNQHEAIVQWLWTVLLNDGLRALCRAGRWTTALHQAERHNGIGQRLLDGRQVTVLAHIASGQHDDAERALRQATPAEPWEHAVAACLHAINRAADDPASAPDADATHLMGTYLATDDPGHTMFTTRLGLTIAELCDGHDSQRTVIDKVTHIAAQSNDAYIAREVLSSPTSTLISPEARTRLLGMVRAAGLGRPLTPAQAQQLMNAISSAGAALSTSLTTAG
jgi:hypothetical protein